MIKKYFFGVVALGSIAVGMYNLDTISSTAEKQIVTKVSDLKPGSYKVSYDKIDSHGWRAFFSMEVAQSGEIASVKFDYDNPKGILKTQDVPYNKAMRSKNGVGPADYCPRFEKNLIIYQDPEEVDAITAATHSSNTFKDFSRLAFRAAKIGDQTPLVVIQPEPVRLSPQGGDN